MEPSKGFRLQGTGVFSLPLGCAAMGESYIVPAHLKSGPKESSGFQMDDLTHFKISLNLSTIYSRLPATKELNQTVLKAIIDTMPASEQEDPRLLELKRRVKDWKGTPTEDATGASFLSHTSISLGTTGVIGVIILTIILCRRKGNGTQFVQLPQPAQLPNPAEIATSSLLTTLQRRITDLERDCSELQVEVGKFQKMEKFIVEIQKKYDALSALL